MIFYLTHNQIDMQRWDECISNSRNGNVYAWSWYLDVVHPNWDALIEDDYESVMPLTGNRKFGIHYLFQPFFTQQLGIFSKKNLDKDKVQQFIEAIPNKFMFAETRLNSGNNFFDNCQNIEYHINTELNLSSDYDSLRKNYNSNTKRDLAKAGNANLKNSDDVETTEIISLFRKNRGKCVKHWGDAEYERFLNLVDIAKSKGHCFVKGVKNTDNKLVAGAVFMASHDRIVFLFSGADESNKEIHALSFLIDNVIKENSGTPKIFDFEGSDNDGLARYYKGFGGHEVKYPSLHFNKTQGTVKFLLKILKGK